MVSTVKAADLDAEMDEPAEIYRDANLRVLVRGIQPAFMGPVRIASDLQRF